MAKQIRIELSDDKYKAHFQAIGEIIGIATFLEADVEVEEV